MAEGGSWRREFERRCLLASGAPEGAVLDEIEGQSLDWAYSEYTAGTDRWLEVVWRGPEGYGRHRWESMAELINAMDAIEEESSNG